MATQKTSPTMEQRETERGRLRRRGLLAGAAALTVGLVAKQTAQPVAAAAPMQFADTATTVINTAAGQTALVGNFTPPNNGNQDMFVVHNTTTGPGGGIQVLADGSGNGIRASSSSGNGVFGQSSTGTGVYGLTNGTAASKGVHGKNTDNGYGVYGESFSGHGVYGFAGANGVGVTGYASTSYGIWGTTDGTGVVAGVHGSSTTAYGIIGSTTAPGYCGLVGITSTPGVAALGATATVPSAYAAYFTGKTVVQGDFVAFGGVKSAAVKDARGQHRLVYCVESPEAWFEDFGEAKLTSGKAEVALDTTFAEIVHAADYHVFLTTYGESNGLFVAKRDTSGFTVQERNKGASSLHFSWRVVAKRKDIAGERLAKFDPPRINIPDGMHP